MFENSSGKLKLIAKISTIVGFVVGVVVIILLAIVNVNFILCLLSGGVIALESYIAGIALYALAESYENIEITAGCMAKVSNSEKSIKSIAENIEKIYNCEKSIAENIKQTSEEA